MKHYLYSVHINGNVHLNQVLVQTEKGPSVSFKEEILPDFLQNDCPFLPNKMEIKQTQTQYCDKQTVHFILYIS